MWSPLPPTRWSPAVHHHSACDRELAELWMENRSQDLPPPGGKEKHRKRAAPCPGLWLRCLITVLQAVTGDDG